MLGFMQASLMIQTLIDIANMHHAQLLVQVRLAINTCTVTGSGEASY